MTGPGFGRRGLAAAPPPTPTPRRLRSNAVAIGVVGALGLGLAGAVAYDEYRCWPPKQGPDTRPYSCFHHGSSYGGGHGWGFASGVGSRSAGVGHASFGGFGGHGAGHGGGG